MKLPLDECVARRLKRDFIVHNVYTVDEAGLKDLKNGKLLRAASGHYEVLITVDQNLPYQQNLMGLNIAVLALAAKRNDYTTLRPLLPEAIAALKQIRPGEIVTIKAKGL